MAIMVAFLAAVLGAFAGGIGTYVAMRGMGALQVKRDIRQSLLSNVLPALGSEQGTTYASGSYHHALVELLRKVRQTEFLSRTERYDPTPPLSEQEQQRIDTALSALARILTAKQRPLRSHFRRDTADWPSQIAD
jgi:hypothetical protein